MADTLIIIPAFNEGKNIGSTLEGLIKKELDADILVINDGSVDLTKFISTKSPIYIINHPINLGYGAALQTGYKFAVEKEYDYIVQFDADGQHNPVDLQILIQEMRKNTSDVVIGSRFLGDPDFHPGRMKMPVIQIFRGIIRRVTKTKVTDPTSGLRGLNQSVFRFYSERGHFPSDYPDADVIIHMLLQNRFILKEIPIGAIKRTQGVSMHSGIRPAIYIAKVMLSITAILIYHTLVERSKKNV